MNHIHIPESLRFINIGSKHYARRYNSNMLQTDNAAVNQQILANCHLS